MRRSGNAINDHQQPAHSSGLLPRRLPQPTAADIWPPDVAGDPAADGVIKVQAHGQNVIPTIIQVTGVFHKERLVVPVNSFVLPRNNFSVYLSVPPAPEPRFAPPIREKSKNPSRFAGKEYQHLLADSP